MSPLAWLQSLVTFRKQGGGFQVPELDALGRIRVALVSSGSVEVGATPPVIVDGSVLWYDTTSHLLHYYDVSRSKWLADAFSVFGGRSGTTPTGSFYRASDSMVLDASTRGVPVPQGCLTSIAWSRTDSGSATLEVLVNGTPIAELNGSSAGAVRDDTINVDFSAGLMSLRNKTGLADTENVQAVVQYRLRS